MPEFSLSQLALLAIAVLAIIGPRVIEWFNRSNPRGDGSAESARSCERCAQSLSNVDNAVHVKIDAFAAIANDLTPQLAEEVWAAIQPKARGRTDATPIR